MEEIGPRRSRSMKRLIKLLLDNFRQAFQSPYFGFVQGHAHLTAEELSRIKKLISAEAPEIIAEFESAFAKLVGSGEAVSYASGRMGFYDLMRIQGIGKGDEVILLGATCSVMVNAVLRTGATPIFSDMDPDTFGSSATSIEICITSNTRLIVAQHSFGIPCDIEPIAQLAKANNIFLLEDCALTLGSKVKGTIVGNFGDAALFSTDHSKPLNTLTGGIVYTQDSELLSCLRESQKTLSELPHNKQLSLWKRLLREKRYCVPRRYGKLGLIDLFSSIEQKLFNIPGPFLSDDFGLKLSANYPYPAKLPAFLAALGLIEVSRWPNVEKDRKILLAQLVLAMEKKYTKKYLSIAYRNRHIEIVPLRFVWFQEDGSNVRNSIAHFVQVSWTWFMRPIIATNEPLERLGYHRGSCSISEKIGPDMINVPCNVSPDDSEILIKRLVESIL